MNGDPSERSVHQQPHKRLLFDRRYGWIVDECKVPSEEALAGGRGMFCVLPIAKSIVSISSSLVNYGVFLGNNILKNHDRFGTRASNAEKRAWFREIERSGLTTEVSIEAFSK